MSMTRPLDANIQAVSPLSILSSAGAGGGGAAATSSARPRAGLSSHKLRTRSQMRGGKRNTVRTPPRQGFGQSSGRRRGVGRRADALLTGDSDGMVAFDRDGF